MSNKETIVVPKKYFDRLVKGYTSHFNEYEHDGLESHPDKRFLRFLKKNDDETKVQRRKGPKNYVYAETRKLKKEAKELFDNHFGDLVTMELTIKTPIGNCRVYRLGRIAGQPLDRTKTRIYSAATKKSYDLEQRDFLLGQHTKHFEYIQSQKAFCHPQQASLLKQLDPDYKDNLELGL